MYKLVPEVCQIIYTSLKEQYLQFPHNSDEWISIINNFNAEYNWPNCLGALDGKHFKVKSPSHSGSMFYNYKKFYSVVLMAVCDASLKFVWASVGHLGK